MTINATAAWLLGLYVAHAEEHGRGPGLLAGTTQNDIVKEYLSRGTYIFPPGPSLRLTVDTIAYTVRHAPKWNPINVCSYHLQEAGATPVQEIAYALATAIGVLDGVAPSGKIDPCELPAVVGRISFFVNSGVRFVEETCKMRAFTHMWDRICAERYGVEDPKLRRFRYGVQVNSLALTEQQPENNVQRIVLETARRDPVEETPGPGPCSCRPGTRRWACPGPWDQQWSLRMQQVLAFESDLLEYGDIFEGSVVIEAKTAELVEAADGRAGRRGGARRRLRGHRRAQARAWCAARPSGCGASRRASRRWSASTASPRPRPPPSSATARSRTSSGSTTASRPSRSPTWSAGAAGATTAAVAPGPRRAAPGGRGREPRRQHHGGHHRPGPCRRHHRGVGRGPARGLRRVPGPDRRRAAGSGPRGEDLGPRPPAPRPSPSARAARRASSWPSPGSTGTPTAPSRSPWRRATPGSR